MVPVIIKPKMINKIFVKFITKNIPTIRGDHDYICTNKIIQYLYLLHFTLKSTTYALALKPKPLLVRSTDRGRDPGSL